MKKQWRFSISGNGAEGATFEAHGETLCEFNDAFDNAMRDTFIQLTHGRAVYGSPGVGCRGPYDITKVIIEQVKQ